MIHALALMSILPIQDPGTEFTEFAKEIERRINALDGKWVDDQVERSVLAERTLKGMTASEQLKQQVRRTIDEKFAFSAGFMDRIREAGSYKLLRIRQKEGKPCALFRMLQGDSVNYHEFLLEAPGIGGVKIIDIFVFFSGEWLSDTYRRSSRLALNALELDTLPDQEARLVKGMRDALRVGQLVREGKSRQALDLCQNLPLALQKEKYVLLMRVQAAVQVSPEEAEAALAALWKEYPDDPSVDFISVDPLCLIMKLDKALEYLDRSNKALGGDPYLDAIRAGIYLTGGKLDKAKEAARSAIEKEKTLVQPHWILIAVSLAEKKWADTVRTLDLIQTGLGIELTDLSDVPDFEEFRKSAEYRQWNASRKK